MKYVRFTKIQQTFKRWMLREDRIADLGKLLKDERFWIWRENKQTLAMFERWTRRTYESLRQLVPESEANVCQHKCKLKEPRLLIAQGTQ